MQPPGELVAAPVGMESGTIVSGETSKEVNGRVVLKRLTGVTLFRGDKVVTQFTAIKNNIWIDVN